MIRAKLINYYSKITNPLASRLAKTGITPNQISILSLLLSIFTAYLIAIGNYLWGGILILFTGLVVDSLDGALARVTGRVTKFGSYLDAIVDRYGEAFYLVAIAYSSGYWLLAFLALFGSIQTSYAKARASMEVKIDNTNWPELFERAERIILLGTGLILYHFFKVEIFAFDLLFWTLVILAAASNLSALQRIFRAKRVIEKD